MTANNSRPSDYVRLKFANVGRNHTDQKSQDYHFMADHLLSN